MNLHISDRKRAAKIKTVILFSIYSFLLIIGGIAFTASNENMSAIFKYLGKISFFCSPFILVYSIFFAIKNNTSKLWILFYIFVLPSIIFLGFELLVGVIF